MPQQSLAMHSNSTRMISKRKIRKTNVRAEFHQRSTQHSNSAGTVLLPSVDPQSEAFRKFEDAALEGTVLGEIPAEDGIVDDVSVFLRFGFLRLLLSGRVLGAL